MRLWCCHGGHHGSGPTGCVRGASPVHGTPELSVGRERGQFKV